MTKFRLRLIGLLLCVLGSTAVFAQSWDAHLAKLKQAQTFKFTGIYGFDGTLWTNATNAPTSDEIKYIVAGFSNPRSLFAMGPKLNGTKYMTIKADDHLIIGKKATMGFVCFKGVKTIILGVFDEADMAPAQANIAVQNFVAYMKSIGY